MSASAIGSDVPLFLVGGTLHVTGVGETLDPQRPLDGFAVAVAVPDFGLLTADVYRRWDELEGPEGETTSGRDLPPGLREGMPIRNDLLPAALHLEPRLGDFIADLRAEWGGPVFLTGSGSACFAFFADHDEAASAAQGVSGFAAVTRGVALRPDGVRRVETKEDE
jgi:4-diphosphocytidyl-2-C-methyl-D-erythritol kinase